MAEDPNEDSVALFMQLDLALISFRQSMAMCEHVKKLGITAQSDQAALYSACMAAIVVTYSVPFGRNDGIGSLSKRYSQGFSSPALTKAHKVMLRIRHTVYAHRSAVAAKSFPTKEPGLPGYYTPRIEIRESASGRGAYVRSHPVLPDIDETSIPDIVELLTFQIERLNNETGDLLANMGTGKFYKPGMYTVGVDFP